MTTSDSDDSSESVESAAAKKARVIGVFDRAAEQYEQSGIAFFAPLGERLVQQARLRPGERVLDVGCGRGHVLLPAARAVGPTGSVLGLDLAPRMVAAANAAAQAAGLTHATARLGDADEPDVPAGSMDMVTAGLVVFFLTDPMMALRRYAAILRPGGRLAMSSFGLPDPRSVQLARTFASFSTGTPITPYREPFGDSTGIAGALADIGFVGITVASDSVHLQFATFEQYLGWMWSHAGRSLLEAIPEDRFAAAVQTGQELFDRLSNDDGAVRFAWPVHFTTARTEG